MVPLKKKRFFVWWRLRRELEWYSFILPTIVCLIVLTYIPTITGIRYSFYKVSLMGMAEKFVGLKNYISLLSAASFHNAIKNTFILALYALLVIPLGYILASLINSLGRTRLQTTFRIGFYLPNILTGVSVILLFQYVLREHGGLLNSFLSALAGREVVIGWLTDARLTKISVSIMGIWSGLGYAMLINLAGLQSIPGEIYESAQVDGCNGLQRWLHITTPNMTGTFSFLLITNVIASFSRFTDLYIISNNSASGRPGASLQTILMYIYQFSFETPNYGISTAGSMILFVMVFIITLFNLKSTGFFKADT